MAHRLRKAAPPERHIMEKACTIAIEQNTCNTRRHTGKCIRKTKVFFKKERRVDCPRARAERSSRTFFEKYQTRTLSSTA